MTNDKRKISDIFEEKIIERKERKVNGEWEISEKVFHKKRPVNVSSTVLRVINFFVDLFVVAVLVGLIEVFIQYKYSATMDFVPLLIYFAYQIVFEYFFQKTVGKILTKSIVVNEYGERPDFKSICIRVLARLIPFEPYSFFWSKDGRWWHDSLAKTYVIPKTELALLNRIMAGEKPRKSDEGQWDEWHKWQ